MSNRHLLCRAPRLVAATSIYLATHIACSQPADEPTPAQPDAGSMRDAGRVESDMRTPGEDISGGADSSPSLDAGVDLGVTGDLGSEEDAGRPQVSDSKAAFCTARSESLRQAPAGDLIEVEPASEGRVRVGGEEMTLRAAISRAKQGDTVVLADGTYTFPANQGGGYTGIYITTPGVTLRSASGNAEAVVIDSNYRDHGNGSAPITIAAADVTVADLTVKRSIYHLVHLWADGDAATLHNLRLVDGGQQFVKSSASDGTIDDVSITCSKFDMTPAGRDNVWGYGALDGNTTCYTGGIDSHEGQNWLITDNSFRGIHCDAQGPARPAHGMDPGARGNQTYQGGLAEHAIHMWDSPEGGGGHLIARNTIVDCARGVGLGFRAEVYDVTVRDNMIVSTFPGSREHDVGISAERAQNTDILHNTVIFTHPDAYPDTIEYRWDVTDSVRVMNNLTNGRIRARNGAEAMLEGNVADADQAWFADPTTGDLHLNTCDIDAVSGKAVDTGSLEPDYDHEQRTTPVDVGADQCTR